MIESIILLTGAQNLLKILQNGQIHVYSIHKPEIELSILMSIKLERKII